MCRSVPLLSFRGNLFLGFFDNSYLIIFPNTVLQVIVQIIFVVRYFIV